MAEHGTWWGLSGVLLGAALLPLNSTMIAVALPDIASEFDRPAPAVAGTLVAGYLVAAILLQSPGGKLGDLFGRRRMIGVGQVVTAFGAVLGMVAPTLAALAVARVLIAAGGAVLVPAAAALLRSELPADRRGRAFGLFGAVMSLAAGIGPIVGGELVTSFGWRATFVVNLPVLVLAASLMGAVRGLGVADRPRRPRFDVVGSVLLAVVLAAFVFGLDTSGVSSAVLLGLCAAALVPFLWWERRVSDPVVDPGLFRVPAFTAGTLLVAVQNLALYALVLELPQVLRALQGLDAAVTGRLLVFLMIATVVTAPLAGRLADRFGPRPVAVLGSLTCLGATALLLAVGLTGPGTLRLPLALLGVGIGLVMPSAQTAALAAVDSARSGAAAGVSSTMRYLGAVVGVAILAGLLDLGGGRPEILAEHRTILLTFVMAFAIGLACAFVLPGRPTGTGAGSPPATAPAGPSERR